MAIAFGPGGEMTSTFLMEQGRLDEERRRAIEAIDRRVHIELSRLSEQVEKLQAFKDWVHKYLDDHGVPHHPPGVHGAEGCRIGDRMDYVMLLAGLAPTTPEASE